MSKDQKDSVPGALLEVFWPLAEGTEDARIKGSQDIVTMLHELQGQVIVSSNKTTWSNVYS